jgi:hypothetical protein
MSCDARDLLCLLASSFRVLIQEGQKITGTFHSSKLATLYGLKLTTRRQDTPLNGVKSQPAKMHHLSGAATVPTAFAATVGCASLVLQTKAGNEESKESATLPKLLFSASAKPTFPSEKLTFAEHRKMSRSVPISAEPSSVPLEGPAQHKHSGLTALKL